MSSSEADSSSSGIYRAPQKEILSPAQLEQFQQSPTHSQLLAYIQRLNDAVIGVKLRDPCYESEVFISTSTQNLHIYWIVSDG
jgi:hypothetical protein